MGPPIHGRGHPTSSAHGAEVPCSALQPPLMPEVRGGAEDATSSTTILPARARGSRSPSVAVRSVESTSEGVRRSIYGVRPEGDPHRCPARTGLGRAARLGALHERLV